MLPSSSVTLARISGEFKGVFFCFLADKCVSNLSLTLTLTIGSHMTVINVSLLQREKNLGSRVALLPGKFLPSGKFFYVYMIFFRTKSGIFLDSMENFHLFWKSFQTISSSRQVSSKILGKIYLICNISREYGKVSLIL